MRLVPKLLLVLALAGTPVVSAAQDIVGTVARQEGVVVTLRDGRPHTMRLGTELLVGDEVTTGRDGKLLLQCSGGLSVVIGPGTTLVLRRFQAERGGGLLDAIFELVTGITRLVGESLPGGSVVTVTTETAIASVRSTDWLLDVTDVSTGVFARDGEVWVTGRAGGAVLLRPGEGTDVRPGEAPTEPRQWGAARRDAALARTSF